MNNELSEAKLRIDIYREAWQDAEKETIKLREENERRHSRIVEQNDWLVRLQEENKKLREENERLKLAVEISVEGHTQTDAKLAQTDAKLVELAHENKKLREEKETLANDRASLVGEANELYEAIGRISGIVNEIID